MPDASPPALDEATPDEARLLEAVRAGRDTVAFDRLEAAWLARGAFRSLASLYRERAGVARRLPWRMELLARLAELLEAELEDVEGAAAVYGQMAQEGDEAALEDQLRLLRARGDRSGVWRALDLAVERARVREARCQALTRRGQAALEAGELAAARADFAAVLSLEPGHLDAITGVSQLLPAEEPPAPLLALEAAVGQTGPGAQRDERFRKLARLADARPDCGWLSLRAWRALAASQPTDAEATERLTALLSGPGSEVQLVPVLQARIGRVPRGEGARALRHQLVRALDALGRAEAALEALRDAVRAEPGNHPAWQELANRAEAGGRHAEYAWALEHAATSTVDPAARAQLWRRLGGFLERVPGKQEEARACQDRAARLERAVRSGATALGPLVQPPRPRSGPPAQPSPARADTDVVAPPQDRVPTAPRPPPPAPASVVVDLTPVAAPSPTPSVTPVRPLGEVGPEPTPMRPLPESGPQEPTPVHPALARAPSATSEHGFGDLGSELTPVRPHPPRGAVEQSPTHPLSPPASAPTQVGSHLELGPSPAVPLSPTPVLAPLPVLPLAPTPGPAAAGSPTDVRRLSSEAKRITAPAPGPVGTAVSEAPALSGLEAPREGAGRPAPGRQRGRPPGAAEATVIRPVFTSGRAGDRPGEEAWDGSDALRKRAEETTAPRAWADARPAYEDGPAGLAADGSPGPWAPLEPRTGPVEAEMRVAGERRDTLPGGLPMDGASTNPGLVPVLLPYDEARRGDRPPEEVPTVAPRSPALPTPLLDGREWRAWSEARARAGDGWLGGLAREVAQALEGEPGTAPEAPRWLLGEPERAQLLPRELSGPLAGMLSACGVALLAASSETQGPPPGQPFTAGAGPGAPAALEALASAVRVLGLRSPPPGCMAQAGPPFALGAGAGGAVRLQVGAFAVQRTLPAGELRFFAGRALFTQLPLLRVLRLVPPEQLEALLSALPAAVRGGRRLAPAAHALRAHLPGDLRSQLAGTLGALGDAPPLEELAMCARHAANRAGLVTCGGVGAAVLALRSKRALDEEVAELLRFVASDGWRVLAAPWYPLSAPPAAGR